MKRALIFGATGGIGEKIAIDLAADGWSLYLHYDHQEKKAMHLQEQLIDQYPNQDFFLLKFSFLASDSELKTLVKNLFPINAVIFAQGITDYNFLSQQSGNTIDKILTINLNTPIKLTALLEPILLKNSYSRIIFLGSVYGKQASALESVYSASKGGLSSFAKGYSREVASANLTVNVLAPGAVATPMNAIFSKEVLNEVKEEIPAGRLASPEDISYWVKSLLDPRANYLTGQTIYINGGWLV